MNNKFVEKTFLHELNKKGIELEDITVYTEDNLNDNAVCFKCKFTSEHIEGVDLFYYSNKTYTKETAIENVISDIVFELDNLERDFHVIYGDKDAHLGYVIMQIVSKYFLDLKDREMVNFDAEALAKKLLDKYGSLRNLMLDFENINLDEEIPLGVKS